MTTKIIIRTDFVDFFATATVRSMLEHYRPPRSVHAALIWPGCLQTLQVFRPDTLVRWHRKGFRLYWTWKSRCLRGERPPISPEVRELIRMMSRDNVSWGAPRIHGKLQLLGIHISQATVAKYIVHHPEPPLQT